MKKVLIIGYNLGGFGGMETVFKKSINILASHAIRSIYWHRMLSAQSLSFLMKGIIKLMMIG